MAVALKDLTCPMATRTSAFIRAFPTLSTSNSEVKKLADGYFTVGGDEKYTITRVNEDASFFRRRANWQ